VRWDLPAGPARGGYGYARCALREALLHEIGDPADPVTRLVLWVGAALLALVVARAVYIKARRAGAAA